MNEPPPDRPSPPVGVPFREIVTDAIRYWEPRRVLYNAALAGVVCAYFWSALPASRDLLNLNALLGLGVLAVLANICYCAAYVVDVFAQLSGFRGGWLRARWLLLALGTAFAAVLTRFCVLGSLLPILD